jgi:hypothetical protein
METPKITKTHLALGGGFVFLIVLIYFLGKDKGRTEKTNKEIDVKVRINDENGNSILYDPSTLVRALHKGLTTTYYFDFSERCIPIQQFYELEATKFMAVVAAYKTAYNVDIQTHMKACYHTCPQKATSENRLPLDYFSLIYQKITNLETLIN